MNNFQAHYNVFILHVLTARFGTHDRVGHRKKELVDFYDAEHKWYVGV